MLSLVEGFRLVVSDPVAEIIEFIRCDVLNMALKKR